MAFIQNDIRIKVGFDLSNPAKVFTLIDDSDYNVNLTSNNKIKGAFKITLGTNILYDNLADVLTNPDIESSNGGAAVRDRSDTQPTPINLPINPDGTLAEGTYRIDYRVYNEQDPETLNTFGTIEVAYTSPKPNLSKEVTCNPLAPYIKLKDNTVYTKSGLDIISTTRLLSLYPQSFVGTTPTTTSSSELILNSFYTVQYIGSLENTFVYDADLLRVINETNFNYTIKDKVVASTKIDVICDTSLCELYCCIAKFEKTLYDNRIAANTVYNNMKANAGLISFYITLLQNTYACNASADVTRYIEMIKILVDCGCNGCGDGKEPILISAINAPYANTGKVLRHVSIGQTTKTWTELINKTYNNDFQDFLVFVDGIKTDITFTPSTGEVDFGSLIVTANTLIEVVFLR